MKVEILEGNQIINRTQLVQRNEPILKGGKPFGGKKNNGGERAEQIDSEAWASMVPTPIFTIFHFY